MDIFKQAQMSLQAGQIAQAIHLLREALRSQPDHREARNLLGICLCQSGDLDEAVRVFEEVLTAEPKHISALINLATALQGLHRYSEAIAHYEKALTLGAANALLYGNLANAHRGLGQIKQALDNYDQALNLEPRHLGALFNKGVLFYEQGEYAEALACFDRAYAVQPAHPDILINRSNTLFKLGRTEESVAGLVSAASLSPQRLDTHLRLAAILQMLGRDAEAIEPLRQAIRLEPNASQPQMDLALVHFRLGQFNEALALLDLLINRQPADAVAQVNRGAVLERLGRYEEALDNYNQAASLKPDMLEAYANRAAVLWRLRRYEEALSAYDLAGGASSLIPYVPGEWLYACMWLNRWEGLDSAIETVLAAVGRGEPVAKPLTLIATPASEAQQLACAAGYANRNHPAVTTLWQGRECRRERIRIGYFSADYYNHATAYLMAGLFERHDRQRFEIVAFNLGAPKLDAMGQRLRESFDQCFEVENLSDQKIAELAYGEQIDIAVDLKGYTGHSRPAVFAYRPAPIQVSYLGYPGTCGAGYMDYIVADATVIPPAQTGNYTEKIVYLPYSYQVNDSSRSIAPTTLSRSEAGLPADAFVFCCFNNNYKITPDLFEAWMRILDKVAGSVLWLLRGNGAAERRLAEAARRRGIAPERLVFAPFLPSPEHLARHQLADLFLDTWYCNAHTTASDALWAGLPLLTLEGKTFAGRVAASLLRAVGLPELIASTPQEYEGMAIELASDRQKLRGLRERLADNRLSQPLFDTGRFTGYLESAYHAMWGRFRQGLAPDHIFIKP